MGKKKIAIFSTGWSGEILYQYLMGLKDGLKDQSMDIYIFMSHAAYGTSEADLHGELNIYKLPNMKEFDAALLFANGLDYPDVVKDITDRCIKADIPVFFTGKEDERFYFAGSDNFVGTRAMAEHLVEVHGVKHIWFIAGSAENMDSNNRMKAVAEVLSEHDLELKPEDICYTNWSPYVAYNYVRNRFAKGDAKPDAIVCANDTLAMVVCSDLEKIGYKVPDDLIVTGFDNEMLAQLYDPAISSVDQRFDNIGRSVAEMIRGVFEGKEVERIKQIPCEFIPSESCGCCAARDFDALRRKIGKDKFTERINDSNFNIKLTTMERIVLQGNGFDSLGEAFEHLNKADFQYEGETFHLMIDPLVEESVSDNQRALRTNGYPAKMKMVYSKDRGYIQSGAYFDTNKIIPQLNPHVDSRFYIVTPLHDAEYSVGYCVFGDDFEKIRDSQMLRKYLERLNIILNRFFQKLQVNALNQRLMQMTETDAMTHVKNRTAFETRLGDLQSKMGADRKPEFGLIVFDVNNLKVINDNLGHEAGDEYIINSCRLICRTFKKSAVYRIGGDEFLVVLERDDYIDREMLLNDLQVEMLRLKTADVPIYEKISVASGMAIYNPKEDFNIQDVFNRADAQMYENKALMKGGKSEVRK